jgi:hypothetical protein
MAVEAILFARMVQTDDSVVATSPAATYEGGAAERHIDAVRRCRCCRKRRGARSSLDGRLSSKHGEQLHACVALLLRTCFLERLGAPSFAQRADLVGLGLQLRVQGGLLGLPARSGFSFGALACRFVFRGIVVPAVGSIAALKSLLLLVGGHFFTGARKPRQDAILLACQGELLRDLRAGQLIQ